MATRSLRPPPPPASPPRGWGGARGGDDAEAEAEGGAFTLFRAPDSLRAAVAVLPEEPAPLAAIGRRVKAVLDPAGVLNPGRMRAGF